MHFYITNCYQEKTTLLYGDNDIISKKKYPWSFSASVGRELNTDTYCAEVDAPGICTLLEYFFDFSSRHLNFLLLTFSKPARYRSLSAVEGNYENCENISGCEWCRCLCAVRSPVCPAGSVIRWRRSTPSLPGPSPSSSASSSPPSPSVPATSPRQRSSCPSLPPWYQNTHVHTVWMQGVGGGGVSFILLIFCTSCRCWTLLNGDRMY